MLQIGTASEDAKNVFLQIIGAQLLDYRVPNPNDHCMTEKLSPLLLR